MSGLFSVQNPVSECIIYREVHSLVLRLFLAFYSYGLASLEYKIRSKNIQVKIEIEMHKTIVNMIIIQASLIWIGSVQETSGFGSVHIGQD